MKLRRDSWPSRQMREMAARQWRVLSQKARHSSGRAPGPEICDEARALHTDLATFLQMADERAIRARADLQQHVLPSGTDWRWRPPMFCGPISPPGMTEPGNGQRLGEEVALWHDCGARALILRQQRNRRATDLAPFGLRLEVMGFTGNYLSIAIDLPDEAGDGLGREHIVRLETVMQSERDITVYGRLNVMQGPNTEQILRQLGDPVCDYPCHRVTEFDLGYAQLSPRPVTKMWLDLIFDAPYANAVTVSDVVLSRHPRADF